MIQEVILSANSDIFSIEDYVEAGGGGFLEISSCANVYVVDGLVAWVVVAMKGLEGGECGSSPSSSSPSSTLEVSKLPTPCLEALQTHLSSIFQ